jgi:predicted nucleic acid-binding protein
MRSYVLDTNVIVRFLIDEEGQHGDAARLVFSEAERHDLRLILTPLVLAESAHVFRSSYGVPKRAVGEALGKLLRVSTVDVVDRRLAEDVLDLCIRHPKLSVVDASILVEARRRNAGVASLDRLVRRLGSDVMPDEVEPQTP